MQELDLENNEKTIRLLKEDDGVYFEGVYKHYFAPLYSFATQYLMREQAEEVVQETMLWLWENRSTLICEMSLKSLLFTMVKNKCLNKINREQIKNRIHKAIKQKYEEQFESPDFYLQDELFQLFRDALDRLPDPFRQVFEMSRMDGLTHKEIAEQLDVSPQTVNYRLGKALETLRNELKDYLPVLLALLIWNSSSCTFS
ncbi:RNA polymerase sigma-70 factor [Proteiniphilum sp. X52]|uniref:RNA polymerase sigma-70 factor n=1 Tax=Proteiniphilum sp. X52 TaxID=2382159 RepID=UPI000F09B5E2|nr:RNA polymerase sigma-70 factor [Proteiniphilum sp. X52]RNC64311.1 RNA polymerase sigma-70 factor [Proteiniphilum sp. X52]